MPLSRSMRISVTGARVAAYANPYKVDLLRESMALLNLRRKPVRLLLSRDEPIATDGLQSAKSGVRWSALRPGGVRPVARSGRGFRRLNVECLIAILAALWWTRLWQPRLNLRRRSPPDITLEAELDAFRARSTAHQAGRSTGRGVDQSIAAGRATFVVMDERGPQAVQVFGSRKRRGT